MDEYYDCSLKQIDDWRKNELYSPEILISDFKIEDMDLNMFKCAYIKVLNKHESLRTIFIKINGILKQKILKGTFEEGFGLHILPNLEVCYSAQSILNAVTSDFKDVSKPPIYKVFVQHQSHGESKVFIALHHIVGDARSMEILAKELNFAYQQLLNGVNEPFPDRYFQLKDYVSVKNLEASLLSAKLLPYWELKLEKCSIAKLINRNQLLAFNIIRGVQNYTPKIRASLKLKDSQKLTAIPQAVQAIEKELDTNPNAAYYSFKIDSSLYHGIKDAASKLKVSIFCILYSALSFTFYSIEGLKNTLMSLVFADRSKDNYDALIGHLIGSIYINYEIFEDQSMHDIIRKNYLSFILSLKYAIYDINMLSHLNLRAASQIHLNYIKMNDYVNPNFVPGHHRATYAVYPLAVKFTETDDCIYQDISYHMSFYTDLDIDVFVQRFLEALLQITAK